MFFLAPVGLILGSLFGSYALISYDIRKDEKELDKLKDETSKLKSSLRSAKSRDTDNFLKTPQQSVSDTLFKRVGERSKFRTDDGNFELSVSAVENPGHRNWETSPSSVSQMSSIISELPLDGVVKHFGNTNYMIVEANGPLYLANGGGYRGIHKVADKSKKIGHARLHKTGLGDIVINPAFIWKVGSIIFAQIHLHDISNKLSSLSFDAKKIAKFQQNERQSGIIGNYRYLEDLTELSPDAVDKYMLGQMEQVYRETYISLDHLVTDLQNIQIDPKASPTASLDEFNHLVFQIFLVFEIICQILKFKAVVDYCPDVIDVRSKKFTEKIGEFMLIIHKKYDELLDREMEMHWSDLFEVITQINEKIEESSKRVEGSFERLTININDMSRTVLSISSQKHQLLLRMDGDRIVGISDCN